MTKVAGRLWLFRLNQGKLSFGKTLLQKRRRTVINVEPLARVIYSSGKVFNGLQTGRLDTDNFLRSGSLDGINSRSDLQLLEDLRDVADFVLRNYELPVDANFVIEINKLISRSGAIRPGVLRSGDQGIGVSTKYGRHEPDALTSEELGHIVEDSVIDGDPATSAINIFINLAATQPFEDGNKRTALFAANAYLLHAGFGGFLSIPYDDEDETVASRFNDALARAYLHNDREDAMGLLRATLN